MAGPERRPGERSEPPGPATKEFNRARPHSGRAQPAPVWGGSPDRPVGTSGKSAAPWGPAGRADPRSAVRVFWPARRGDRGREQQTAALLYTDDADGRTAPYWEQVPPPGRDTAPSRDVTAGAPPIDRG